MGRQRLRCPQTEDSDTSNRPASLGRCQLIQQFLKQRTGKTRSRKQIASRLQRLRQSHKDDPRSKSSLPRATPMFLMLLDK